MKNHIISVSIAFFLLLFFVFRQQEVIAQRPSFESINLNDIKNAALSALKINGSNNASNQLTPGTIIVYQTNEGRFGKLMISQYGYNISVKWTTYNKNQSSIYSNGNSLTIRGTWNCDLDKGRESSAGVDFWWEQVDKTIRYLVPKNGAKFAVYYTAYFIDNDKDGIADETESMLLKRFAPMYLFDEGEGFKPSNADWYVKRSELLPSGDEEDPPIFTKDQLSANPGLLLTADLHTDHVRYCSFQDGRWVCESDIWKNPKRTLYHLNVYNDFRGGQDWPEILAQKNVGLYGHVTCTDYNYKKGGSPVAEGNCPLYKIEYWQFFPYNWNDRPASIGDHEAEWETIQLLVDANTLDIVTIFHYAHGDEIRFDMKRKSTDNYTVQNCPFKAVEYRGPNYNKSYNRWEEDVSLKLPDQRANNNLVRLAWDEALKQYTHPLVYIEEGTHAFWPSEFWDTCEELDIVGISFTVGCSWSHGGGAQYYMTEPGKRNLGEVEFPLHEVNDAELILRYNGRWGAYGHKNDPPSGPLFHTE